MPLPFLVIRARKELVLLNDQRPYGADNNSSSCVERKGTLHLRLLTVHRHSVMQQKETLEQEEAMWAQDSAQSIRKTG
jgi:hypothetical protein